MKKAAFPAMTGFAAPQKIVYSFCQIKKLDHLKFRNDNEIHSNLFGIALPDTLERACFSAKRQ
jgi:hypothetical protein